MPGTQPSISQKSLNSSHTKKIYKKPGEYSSDHAQGLMFDNQCYTRKPKQKTIPISQRNSELGLKSWSMSKSHNYTHI